MMQVFQPYEKLGCLFENLLLFFYCVFFMRIAKIAAVVELPFFLRERERVFLTGGEREREERGRERERERERCERIAKCIVYFFFKS